MQSFFSLTDFTVPAEIQACEPPQHQASRRFDETAWLPFVDSLREVSAPPDDSTAN